MCKVKCYSAKVLVKVLVNNIFSYERKCVKNEGTGNRLEIHLLQNFAVNHSLDSRCPLPIKLHPLFLRPKVSRPLLPEIRNQYLDWNMIFTFWQWLKVLLFLCCYSSQLTNRIHYTVSKILQSSDISSFSALWAYCHLLHRRQVFQVDYQIG